MRITTWNVNGIRAVIKKDFDISIEKINPDILCLQETKAQDNEVEKALNHYRNQYHLYVDSAEKKGYSGTTILTKTEPKTISKDIDDPEFNKEGRILTAEYPDFFLVNVYTPNAGQQLKRLDFKERWNELFQQHLESLHKKKPVIACGDFNVAHRAIDLKNPKSNYNKTAGYTQVEIDGMDRLLNAGFIDVFRNLHPDEVAYTYWGYRFNARARNAGWRIDYFIVSPEIMKHIKSITIHNEIMGSDHCPVSLDLMF